MQRRRCQPLTRRRKTWMTQHQRLQEALLWPRPPPSAISRGDRDPRLYPEVIEILGQIPARSGSSDQEINSSK
ncbi:hypothetical protein Y032_0058g2911 [Ancylostoma ceylanicum]|uniref:Uncharacterized protein n=1 Tax=Ancylostoma ceylanicum TaxID=53326 RepID=A0A016U485_9BILA|nr:hypothetical protein Y032_0058g2911 [Ancylostoma ceylanicum]